MATPEDPIRDLRAALDLSPDNAPLRKHLANLLFDEDRGAEALAVLKEGVKRKPKDPALKLALADAFRRTGNLSAAIVILEEELRASDRSARARILLCKVLLQQGDEVQAERHYRRAIDDEEALRDTGLEERFGWNAGASPQEPDTFGPGDAMMPLDQPSEHMDLEASLGIETPDLAFKDVGGMDHVKKEIRSKVIGPLENPELFAAYGKKVGGGILLYGPPGCGKTYFARATAGEVEANFLSVGIHDVMDMWIGESEKKLHEIFELARASKPCVLFFDEVDALGAARSDMKTSSGRHLINQFLSELDGIKADNEGVVVLAATNMPWNIDSAFRRPGRFDRVVFVPPPDDAAKELILELHLRGKPMGKLDLTKIAKKTKDFSGADLMAVIEQAVEQKLEAALETGVPEPLVTKDLLAAVKAVRPTTKEWFASARNYVLYANEGGLYDDLKPWLGL